MGLFDFLDKIGEGEENMTEAERRRTRNERSRGAQRKKKKASDPKSRYENEVKKRWFD